MIFEIPLPQSDRFDLLVVWEEFKGLRSEDRTGLIMDAYKDQGKKIAQALGVSYDEALEQSLLPFRVVPLINRPGIDARELRKSMLDQGAIPLSEGKVDLRFPSLSMALKAQERLFERQFRRLLVYSFWADHLPWDGRI